MRSCSSRLALLFVLLVSLTAPSADARPPPTLAVLYFDNTAKDASLDPLRKGLADMLITDLSSLSGWRIVEREKLDSLVKEINLTSTGFIDTKTAGKLGHGLGAQYILMGAYLHAGKQLRLDVRLLKVTSGEVVVADQILGNDTNVFELEKQLVGKLADHLDAALPDKVKATWARRPPATIQDVAAYGVAVDARDRGDMDSARRLLRQLLQTAPGLDFASLRLDQIEELEHAAAMTRNVKLPGDIIAATKRARRGNVAACSEVMTKLGTVYAPVAFGINTFSMSDKVALTSWKRAGLANAPTDLDDMHRQIGASVYVFFRLADYVWGANIPEKVCAVDTTALVFIVMTFGAMQNNASRPSRKVATMYDADGQVAISPDDYDRLLVKYANEYLERFPTGVWATTIPTFLDPAVARLKEADDSSK